MENYVLYNWNGQLKWAEINGVYFVDHQYLAKFLSTFTGARKLSLNVHFV